jgi:hypothetical protein
MNNFNDEVCEYSYSTPVTENFDDDNDKEKVINWTNDLKKKGQEHGLEIQDAVIQNICGFGECFFSENEDKKKICIGKCVGKLYEKMNKK